MQKRPAGKRQPIHRDRRISQVTYKILLDALSKRRRHVPDARHEVLKLRESVRIFHGVQLRDLADGRSDLLQNAWSLLLLLTIDSA